MRLTYWVAVSSTACLEINRDPISDMDTFHHWALTIAEGDWLGRGDFHPFHPWQEAVASKEQWDRWYGHVFHQEPFYPYLAAMVYLLAPRMAESVLLLQVVLGAAGCGIVYLAGRRFFGEPAGIAAGCLSVLYGPYLYYESLLLRDSFLIPLHAAFLWTVAEAGSRSGRSARRWWSAVGFLGGVSLITKASILPCVVIIGVWAALRKTGEPLRERLRAAGCLAGFFLLPLAPVVVRNITVGAPPLALTTRGPIEFINGNNARHAGVGWFDGEDAQVSGYARDVLSRAQGSLISTVGEVLADWRGNVLGFVGLQMRKAGYLVAPFEMPNNASYSFFRQNLFQLRWVALSFAWISPLALMGLPCCWRERRRVAPLLLFLATGGAVVVAFYVIARFRAPLMPAVMILAGVGLVRLLSLARQRVGRDALVAIAILGCAVSANLWFNYPDRDLIRPQDYLIATRAFEAEGDRVRALGEAMAGRELFPKFGVFHRITGLLLIEQGEIAEARKALEVAISLDPGDAEARTALVHIDASSAP